MRDAAAACIGELFQTRDESTNACGFTSRAMATGEMDMKRFIMICTAMMALMSAFFTTPAAASIVTLNETFTITGFSAGAPLSTLTGSLSLSFDNSTDAIDTTGTALTISVPGLSLAGTTTQFAYNHASDRLHLGAYSVGNFVTNAGTNYIDIEIGNVSTTPLFLNAQYSQVGAAANFSSTTGTLTPVVAIAGQPIPALGPWSLVALSTLLALLGLRRR